MGLWALVLLLGALGVEEGQIDAPLQLVLVGRADETTQAIVAGAGFGKGDAPPALASIAVSLCPVGDALDAVLTPVVS